MKSLFPISCLIILVFTACKGKTEYTFPKTSSITESVYSSGIIKSDDQYNFYAQVSGLVKEVFVEVGDTVKIGDPILRIENERQQINNQNALLSANYYTSSSNQKQLDNLLNSIDIAKAKKKFDSLQYQRQVTLNDNGVGVKTELEISKFNYDNSVVNYYSAVNQLAEFKRQLGFNSSQALNNYKISAINERDYTIVSQIDGIVYDLNCLIGEVVNPQMPLGTIGSSNLFLMEMLIDESDILQIALGQKVFVKLDSYDEIVHESVISKIYPFMNVDSKSFKIEATFVDPPKILYPNMNFEANILIQSKEDVLLIPREYLIDGSIVIKANGDSVIVETGLKDYGMIEILKGVSKSDEIVLPEK